MVEIDCTAIRNKMIEEGTNIKTLSNNAKISIATAQKIVTRGGKVQFKTIGRIAKSLNIEPAEIIKAYV